MGARLQRRPARVGRRDQPYLLIGVDQERRLKLTAADGNFCPSHNSFFRNSDETETHFTFQAAANANRACDSNRYVMVQPITANDGTLNIGIRQASTYEWAEPSV
ncbi:alpha-N-arabinofuranosidase [Colletotrichum orchidophilum]|uniref:Alpha-N-arabinofuranosidase n=1 Tax=Colletotrichum orchidophilum TaxID=1209926 RepID=A0A1G4BEA0_9PEZI|nr:alpha-N-arabinofuranosidase [Colletotrichum orchidophilum]OHE99673.1 alpha-N-arabinofuranosidase [Colletotrichum orchidophilum]